MHTPFVNDFGSVAWWFEHITHLGICLIAVPFFFVVSGFFIAGHLDENGWWQREVGKRVGSLVIPYFVWNVGWCVFLLAVTKVTCGVWCMGPKAIFNAVGLNPVALPCVGQLWYVRSLFVLVLISPLICKFLTPRRLLLLLAIYALICPWGGVMCRLRAFFRIMLSVEGLFYFAVGMYLRRNKIDLNERSYWLSGIVSASLLVAYLVLIRFDFIIVGQYCRWAALPFLLIFFWRIVPSVALPRFLVGVAFPIYLVHRVVLYFLAKLGICTMRGSVFSWIGMIILVFALSALLSKLIMCSPKLVRTGLLGGR